jgi:hypothetical protein
MRKRTKIAAIITIAILSAFAVSALGAIFYQLTVPSTWQVQVAYGLELDFANGTKVTSLPWLVSPLGSQTQSFILKNTGNHDGANVTLAMPANTSTYQFTTTFANSTIPQGGSYSFSITLTDLGMDSTQTYSGNFVFSIVDSFPASNDSFAATQVSYNSDTAQYFGFISDGYNASSYKPGDTVLYDFTTENVNSSMEIQGLTYGLQLWNSQGLVSTICDGLTVAYYQTATAYELPSGVGYQGNSTHMTTQPLMPGQSMTIWQSFAAPAGGSYYLVLVYESHNAAPALTWTLSNVDAGGSNNGADCGAEYYSLSGATAAGVQGTVSFTIYGLYNAQDWSSWCRCSWTLVVQQNGVTIQTIASSSYTFYATGSVPESYTFTPTVNGALTLLLTTTENSA